MESYGIFKNHDNDIIDIFKEIVIRAKIFLVAPILFEIK